MCFTNLIQVDTDLGHQPNVRHNYPSANQSLKDRSNNCLHYDPSVLRTICRNTRHDQ